MKTQVKNKFIANLFWYLVVLSIFNQGFAQEKTLGEMTVEELMKVEVFTASKRKQKLIEVPATVYVITEDDIRQFGYRDLKDVLPHIPGVEYAYPQSHIHGGQRGGAGNWSQTKLLINGRQVNMLFSGEVYVASQYPLKNVKQIEIIQGPASALYGTDAYTGVINIITKNSENVENGSDFSVALGSMDKIADNKEVNFNVISNKKRLGITVSGTIFNQEGPDFTEFLRTAEYTEINRQVRNNMFDSLNPYRDNDRAYVMNADFIYSMNENSKIKLGFYHLENEDGGGFENPEITFTSFDMNVEQTLAYFNYENQFTELPLKVSLDAFYEHENFFVRHQNLIDEGDNPPYIGAFNLEDSKLYNINLQIDITPESISNYLIAGLGYRQVNIAEIAHTGLSRYDSTMGKPIVGRYLYPPKGYFSFLVPYLDQNEVFAYIQDQHSFLDDRLQVTFGGRFDHHNIYGDILNLRSGLYFKIFKGFAIKALYGEAFREPTIFELSMNPELMPAEMNTWEFSLNANPNKNFVAQVAYYQNSASKLIAEQRGTTGIGSKWDNSGSKKTQGIESLVKYQYYKFRGNIWYNYEHNPDDSNLLNIAKNKFGAGVIYKLSKSVSLSLQGNYIGKINTNAWDADANDIVITIPEYKSLNLTILANKLEFSNFPKIDLSLSIYNLFNTKNYYPNMRGPNPSRYLAERRSIFIRSTINL